MGRVVVPVVVEEEEDGLTNKKEVVVRTEMAEVIKEVAELEAMKDSKVVTRTTRGAFRVVIKEKVVEVYPI